jgi:hypothetical protein
MSCVIGVIADEIFPKPPLPDAALAARALRRALRQSRLAALWQNRS